MLTPPRNAGRMVPASALDGPFDETLPLQLAAAWLLIRATPMNEQGALHSIYSTTFIAGILDLIAREAFEVNPHSGTYASMLTESDRLITRESALVAKGNDKRRARGQAIPPELEQAAEAESWMLTFRQNFEDMTDGCACIDTVERELRNRISEDHDEGIDGPEPLERGSPLGLYFRKLLVSLRRLSFHETTALSRKTGEWCGAQAVTAPRASAWLPGRIDEPNPLVSQEDRMLTRTAIMDRHQAAAAEGDVAAAYHHLKQFYDYQPRPHGDPQKPDGLLPHSLLNLAFFHYQTGGLEQSRDAIDEAIRWARKNKDSDCLKRCLGLSHRLKMEMEGSAWPGSEVPNVKSTPVPLRRLMKTVTPMDDLWSIKAAVDLGEPVPVAFRRVYTALSRSTPQKTSTEDEAPPQQDEYLNIAAWHVAQAGLWSLLGADALAEQHEGLALTATDLDDNTFISIQLSRAERIARSGRFDVALALLLDAPTVQRLAIAPYRVWASTIWSILGLQASIVSDPEASTIITNLRADPTSRNRFGPGGPVRDIFDPAFALPLASANEARGVVFAHGYVTDALKRAEGQRNAPPHIILGDILAALELASGLGLWPLYRTGTVTLAETLLRMEGAGCSMAAKADAEIAAVWEELVTGSDALLMLRATVVRAKATTALGLGGSDEEHEEVGDIDETLRQQAETYADLAIEKATKLGATTLGSEARELKSMLQQLVGRTPDPLPAEEEPRLAERVRQVGEVVRLVGVRVAEGWR